jgi:hypothetical protein
MKKTLTISFLSLLQFKVLAGDTPKNFHLFPSVLHRVQSAGDVWDRIRFGGNFGLQFGNPTTILVSPSLGYVPGAEWLDDKLMLGVGLTYIYSRFKIYSENNESNIFGGRLFGRYLVRDNVFAYSELEHLNASNYYMTVPRREWVSSFFVGGGYLMPISDRGGISVTILYNLTWTTTHLIYSSPWNVRFGVMF